MKKIVYLFILMSLVSCDKEDPVQNSVTEEEFYELVEGYYDLRVAVIDTPIDLNHDGVAHTNLYEEVVYCGGFSLDLNSYSCNFQHKSSYSQVSLDIPTSEYVGPDAGTNTCLRDTGLFYDFKVNVENREVMLVQCDYCDEFAAGFQAEILDLDWQNDRAYFTLNKRFLTSSGEKKWVTLYLEYEKVLEDI